MVPGTNRICSSRCDTRYRRSRRRNASSGALRAPDQSGHEVRILAETTRGPKRARNRMACRARIRDTPVFGDSGLILPVGTTRPVARPALRGSRAGHPPARRSGPRALRAGPAGPIRSGRGSHPAGRGPPGCRLAAGLVWPGSVARTRRPSPAVLALRRPQPRSRRPVRGPLRGRSARTQTRVASLPAVHLPQERDRHRHEEPDSVHQV
jgi:hypothetical protein